VTHTAATQAAGSADSFGTRGVLSVGATRYEVFRLAQLDQRLGTQWRALPYSLKVLLENLLRWESAAAGAHVTAANIESLASWDPQAQSSAEIQFTPARVIMQDFTGVPCLVDLATMREAVTALGGDPAAVTPLAPAELVIDHSVIADVYGRPDATSSCAGGSARSTS
jgi:aconitate hydratase